MNLHSEARTTPKIREEIKASKGNMSTRLANADEMKATLTQYLDLYNHSIV